MINFNMEQREVFIAGLITADHILIKNGDDWKYIGSIGGGSAANVYLALKTFKTPVKLIGAVGEKKPSLSKVAIKDFGKELDENIIYFSKNAETREYYHLIEKVNDIWRHKFSASSPISNSKQSFSVQLRKSYFFDKFKDSITTCAIFKLDRLSKGLLELAKIAKKRHVPIIFDFVFKIGSNHKSYQISRYYSNSKENSQFLKKSVGLYKFPRYKSRH